MTTSRPQPTPTRSEGGPGTTRGSGRTNRRGRSRTGAFARWLGLATLLLAGAVGCSDSTAPAPPIGTPGPDPDAAIALEPVAEGFVRPLGVVAEGAYLYVLEQGGTVRVVRDDGTVRDEPFLDLRGHDFVFPDGEPADSRDERGLLGLAFRPGSEGNVYVHYNDAAGDTVVSRMEIVAGPAGADAAYVDPTGEEEILVVDQPDGSSSHLGGQLAFGPDGMLYLALGDGGTGGARARLPSDPLGSILRLDVDRPEADHVPADGANPFAGDPEVGDPRVWHYGLRNPWRFSFDLGAEGGANDAAFLWIADVGENRVEEVNRVPADEGGHDFGWNVLEGDLCFPDDPCDDAGTTRPLLTYGHDDDGRKSVTGGYVYRGEAIPALRGRYVFGDFMDGAVRSVEATADAGARPTVLALTQSAISSLGLDPEGEILLVDYVAGRLFRIVPD